MTAGSTHAAERRKTRRLFNLVAPVYPLIEGRLAPSYERSLGKLQLDSGLSVLDLATGTGILAGAFAARGHQVQGLDFADRLLRRARRRFPAVAFRNFDLVDLAEIPARSFGIVCMGFLLHGVAPEFRRHILGQAARIASHHVLVFDYGRPGNWVVHLVEWLEGPHYPVFLAASRLEEFTTAGLAVHRDFRCRDYGHAWLCAHLPTAGRTARSG